MSISRRPRTIPRLIQTAALIAICLPTLSACVTYVPQRQAQHKTVHPVAISDELGNPLADVAITLTFWQYKPNPIPPFQTHTRPDGTALLDPSSHHPPRTLFVSKTGYGSFALPYDQLKNREKISISLDSFAFKPIVQGIDKRNIDPLNITADRVAYDGINRRAIINHSSRDARSELLVIEALPLTHDADSAPGISPIPTTITAVAQSSDHNAPIPSLAPTFAELADITPATPLDATPPFFADDPDYPPHHPEAILRSIQSAAVPVSP